MFIEFLKSFLPENKFRITHKDGRSKMTFHLPWGGCPEKFMKEAGMNLNDYELEKL